MTWKWFFSRTVRQAHHAAKHVRKIVDHQRDLLSQQAIDAVCGDVAEVERVAATGSKDQIGDALGKLEKSANKWLKPYPNAAWRENVEVMLVAIAVAMGIRTFFVQPFKIPTGSMQPTLYGVTDENLIGRSDVQIPGALAGFIEYWFRGVSYKHVVAKGPGQLVGASEPTRFILFNLKQDFRVGDYNYTVWFPPDRLLYRAGLVTEDNRPSPREFKAGDDLIKLRIISGDHLFVDRVSYNFRRPSRGDIVVFETHGITTLSLDQQDTYYIKRLVGLGGETLMLKKDYTAVGVPRWHAEPVGHLVVDGKEITAATPHFENLYSFPDAPGGTNKFIPYKENHYCGHALMEQLQLVGDGQLSQPFQVRPEHYFVMGDNTMNSSDSRFWGDFSEDHVIGKSFFVYWPIGATTYKSEERPSRFGWAQR